MSMCVKTPSKRTIHNLCLSGFCALFRKGKNSMLGTTIFYICICIAFAFDEFYWKATEHKHARRRENVNVNG